MHECLGKHLCVSSPFPIAILNGTSSFFSLVQDKLNMPSGHYYSHCSSSGRSNHLITIKIIGTLLQNTLPETLLGQKEATFTDEIQKFLLIKWFERPHQRRVPLAFISILPGIHANHTEKWGVPLVMYGG